jgi:hypothetical protein
MKTMTDEMMALRGLLEKSADSDHPISPPEIA